MRTTRTTPRRATALATFLLLSLSLVGLALAHDVWLAPERFVLVRGDTLVVRQFAGTELDTEHDLALLRTLTRRFELITPDGAVDLLAELPDVRTQPEIKPVLKRRLDYDGLGLVVMDHAFIWEEFSREQFLENLEHEGFDPAAFEPHMGDRDSQSERYARTLKSLVQVGEAAQGDLHRRIVGQKLEILLLQNPYALDPGDRLDVQVLFEGEPLAGALVKAHGRGEGGAVSTYAARTGDDGVAGFELERAGAWLVRLIHMLPCGERADIDCEDVHWESYWSSYTFEVR